MQFGSAPYLKIKGRVSLGHGDYTGDRKLMLSDVDDGKRIDSLDVSGSFKIRYSDLTAYEGDRGAYRGMRFHVKCPEYPVSAARIFTDQQMAASNLEVNPGKIIVWDGDVHAYGKIVDQNGATRWGCFVGLYNPGNNRPVRTWITIGGFSEDLNLADAGDRFTFEVTCPGSGKRGASRV